MTRFALRVGLIVPRFAPFRGGMETYVAHAAAALARKGAEVTVITHVPRALDCLAARYTMDTPSSATTCRSATSSTCRRRRPPVGHRGRDASTCCGCTTTTHRWLGWRRSGRRPHSCSPRYHGVGHTPLRQALHRVYRPARRIVVDTDAQTGLGAAGLPPPGAAQKNHRGSAGGGRSGRGCRPYHGELPVVLTVARQEPYKRTDLLVRAVAELRNRAMPARLVVVGDGSGMAAYRKLAARLGAEDVVRFTGVVDEETLRRWWASASLYAAASRQEAYSIGLAEALVAGRSVVASDIPDHGEVIRRARPGVAARLCQVDAPHVEEASQFTDAMARLLSPKGSCNERAARCTLPSAAEIVEQLLETLSAARL
jgi:glycosyltransferase involved in cell wall biosynthesis